MHLYRCFFYKCSFTIAQLADTLIAPMGNLLLLLQRSSTLRCFSLYSRKCLARIPMTLSLLIDFHRPFRRFIPKAEYYKGIKILEEFIQPFIDATLTLTPEQLESISKSDKEFTFLHNMALFSRDPKVIRDQIMAVLLAGRDTTAATLSWTIYELSNYPEIWRKLRSRVLETVGPEAAPTYEDLKDLTCLTHALYETLRLYPAVPFNVRTCREYLYPYILTQHNERY